MTRYVALLRGVNLGPTNKVPMPELRRTAEGLGYQSVATYINSGNLLFDAASDVNTVRAELEAAIRRDFGLAIEVMVRTADQLRDILAANPYPEGDPSRVTIAFLRAQAPADAAERLAAVAREHEPFTVAGTEIYVHYGKGLGTSKLAEQFSKIVGVSATVRNLRTVRKLGELL